MIEINMNSTWSYMRIKETCMDRINSVIISCVFFRHFVLQKNKKTLYMVRVLLRDFTIVELVLNQPEV